MQQVSYSGKGRETEANDQISLMLQLSRIEEKLKPVQKTLIVYDIYTKEDQKLLLNLHSIGGALISPKTASFEGQVQENSDETKTRYYLLNEKKMKQNGLVIDQVELRQEHQKDKPSHINIKLYEGKVEGEKVRVVTIPILKSLQDKQDFSDIDKMKNQIEKRYHQLKKNVKGEELQNFQRQCDKEIRQLEQNLIKQFLPKHLKMFIIEALLNLLKKKTQLISICHVISFLLYKNRTKEVLTNEVLDVFQAPRQATQFIVHSVAMKKAITQIQDKKDIFSGIWTFTGEQEYKFTCLSSQWFNDIYYTKDIERIRSKMYNTENKNSSIGKVVNMFTKSWSDIVFDSTTCIAPFIEEIYYQLKYGQKLNQNLVTRQKYNQMALTPSKKQASQLITIYTFKQIEKMYISQQNGLKEKYQIKSFFDESRLDGFQIQKKKNPVPQEIGFICFVHFFQKINNQFCQKILEYEKKSAKERMDYIVGHLKSVYSLVNDIRGVSENVTSSNMQKYFNFLTFLFNTSELIESVTKSTLPITSVIRSFFNKLKEQQNRLLTYIQSNQDKILSNQELNYYLIYIKIIEEISNNAEESVLQIKLFLHMNKADMISTRYIIYPEKMIQAIKSYCTIINLRNKLPETRRDRFNKLIIEKRIAKLCSLCKLHEEALKIFKKNHLVKSVQRCYKDIFLLCEGDERATRHIELGKYLEDEVSFSKAIDNYESAYEFARTIEKRKEALRAKLDCQARRISSRQENEKSMQRFLSGQITEEQFNNLRKVGQDKSQGDTLFENLINKLVFEKNKCRLLE